MWHKSRPLVDHTAMRANVPAPHDAIPLSTSAVPIAQPPKLIAVGLVSTGTQSLASAARQLGLRVMHSAPLWQRGPLFRHGDGVLAASNLSLTEKGSVLAETLQSADVFADIPFLSPTVIEQAAIAARRRLVFISTNRSRESWITSIMKSSGKGGVTFRHMYDVPTSDVDCAAYGCIDASSRRPMPLKKLGRETWKAVWERHQRLLLKHQIPAISLEDKDATKWQVLCDALRQHLMWRPVEKQCRAMSLREWPRIGENPEARARAAVPAHIA